MWIYKVSHSVYLLSHLRTISQQQTETTVTIAKQCNLAWMRYQGGLMFKISLKVNKTCTRAHTAQEMLLSVIIAAGVDGIRGVS